MSLAAVAAVEDVRQLFDSIQQQWCLHPIRRFSKNRHFVITRCHSFDIFQQLMSYNGYRLLNLTTFKCFRLLFGSLEDVYNKVFVTLSSCLYSSDVIWYLYDWMYLWSSSCLPWLQWCFSRFSIFSSSSYLLLTVSSDICFLLLFILMFLWRFLNVLLTFLYVLMAFLKRSYDVI